MQIRIGFVPRGTTISRELTEATAIKQAVTIGQGPR
jgi:hypothetical protein